MNGLTNYLAGLSAEETVLRHYESHGAREVAKRWRGKSGEIDLIVEDESGLVFVEVKAASCHDRAAERLTSRQIGRVAGAAEEFLVKIGRPNACIRIDAALVDHSGSVETLTNITV